jgi:hypothetical protein
MSISFYHLVTFAVSLTIRWSEMVSSMSRGRYSLMKKGVRTRKKKFGLRALRAVTARLLAGLSVGYALFGLILSPAIVSASTQSPSISMFSVVGFSGYFGRNDWVPVTVTIHHTGKSEDAQLSVPIHNSLLGDKSAAGMMHWSIRLPANRWKTVQIFVPGFTVDGSTPVSCTVNGRVEAVSYLNGNAVDHVALVAVLSSETQSAQFLTGSSTGNEPVLPVSVNPSAFPASPNLLNGLTCVVATPDTLSQLSSEQQAAILTWIKLGGMLLVSGTDRSFSFWNQYFPIRYGDSARVKADSLDLFAGISVPAPSHLQVNASGIQQNATLWASAGNQPLLASMPLGRGTVWQTSFSTMDNALLGWSGYPSLWTSVLRQSTSDAQSALVPLLDEKGVLSFSDASDSLSPLRVPSLGVWILVFSIYVLLVGPVIFFVLRRYNRASYAWFILPAVGGFTTLCIYLFGLMERPPGLLNEGIGVLELVGDGTAETYGVQAFMSPYWGGLHFELTQPMFALPLAQGTAATTEFASVMNGQMTHLTFGPAPRWSVRYLYSAGAVSNQGELSVQLVSSFGMLLGTVKNNTPYPLHHVAMFWKNHMYELGDLAPSQTVPVNQLTEAPSNDKWAVVYGSYNHDLTRGIGRPLGAFAASSDWTSTLDNTGVMFVATTTARTPSLPGVSTTQDVASSQSVVLVRQFAPVSIYSGGPFS